MNENNSSSSMSKSLVIRLGINDVLVAELDTIRSQMKQIINVMKKHTLLVCIHTAAGFTASAVNATTQSVRLSTCVIMTVITTQSVCIFAMFSFATKCIPCSLSLIKNDDISQVETVVVQPAKS